VTPHDVLEDVAEIAALVEGGEDGVDRPGSDRVPAFHELDELVDDGARLADLLVLPLERQPVAAKEDAAAEPIAEPPQDGVVNGGELGRNLVRDVENFLQYVEV
jgi:hypothetical protein